MRNKVLALGITTIVIFCLVVGTAFVLMSTDSNEQPKYIYVDDQKININVDDQEIISDKFLYYHGVNISWFGEAAFRIKSGDLVVYIDPYLVSSDAEKADIIISTHIHGEHLSLTDVRNLSDSNTSLYTPEPDPSVDGNGPTPSVLLRQTPGKVCFIEPGMVVNHSGIILEFVPAYNIDKYNYYIPGQLWHPPWANWIGVIVEIGETRIYHPGDCDHIPEMEQIDCNIFLAPIGGVAVMTPQEAAEAVESLKITSNLKYAIPMHYFYVLVTSPYVPSAKFAAKANCTVVILKPEYFD
ncbi:MAG: MBL fold metallo-hydrolase [Candidatus Hodarchaeales archaeon]|jgi:L-ascorbate metabolism protein UlaG (beta-lactamase superfamily)